MGRKPLDADALALFARKGLNLGPQVLQAGEVNGVKVRRVMQIASDLAGPSLEGTTVLDLGCGEGVYAIEAGLRGAQVLALDARTQRMDEGAAVAARHDLQNVRFRQEDVRRVSRASIGDFDVVFCLGLLYHLDVPDVFLVLDNIYEMCRRLLVVDTFISLDADLTVSHDGKNYEGERVREHDAHDSSETRMHRVLRSIDNEFSFRFTWDSLMDALRDAGFSSVFRCSVPTEPLKPVDRVTVAAIKGEPVSLETYPWVNDRSEGEIEEHVRSLEGGGP